MLSLQIFSKENPENLYFVIVNELEMEKQDQRSTTENASQQQLTQPIFSH